MVDDRGGLPVFIKHGSMFDRCLGLVLPILILDLACGLLLSDCSNIFPEESQA